MLISPEVRLDYYSEYAGQIELQIKSCMESQTKKI